MTFIAGLILKLSLLALAITGVFAGRKYLHMKDDNIIEEIVEQALKDQTGFDIDLTPDSREVPTKDASVVEISDVLDFSKDSVE